MKKSPLDKWLVCDCETDAFDGQSIAPFVWALITSEGDRLLTYDTQELVAYLREFDGIAYAHNGGKFDWLMPGVVEHLEKGEIMLINARLAKARIGKCELRDSWLIIPSALSEGGDKAEFDYTLLNRKNAANRKSSGADKQVMQDCVALYNLVAAFRERHGDALTMPGAALKAWEKMGGSKRRYGIYHDSFFRPWYFGGRCQVFQYGAPLEGEFESFDLVSAYPYAMTKEHPLGTKYQTSTDYLHAPGASFWRVMARSRGAFPLKDKWGLYFPDDAVLREYYITGWELIAALDTGTANIESAVGWVPDYLETLAPYVEKFYQDKAIADAAGDACRRLIAKTMLVSLYGKYSANPENYQDYLLVEPGAKSLGYELDMEGDGYDILSKPSANAQYFDVALGASITGYTRAQLWRGLCASEGNVYCDTDNIKARRFVGDIGSELGQWKSEGVLDQLHIAGKKLYCGRDVKSGNWLSAHKGFSKLDTDIEDIKAAARGEIVAIGRSAPSINISGAQTFIKRRMRRTGRGKKFAWRKYHNLFNELKKAGGVAFALLPELHLSRREAQKLAPRFFQVDGMTGDALQEWLVDHEWLNQFEAGEADANITGGAIELGIEMLKEELNEHGIIVHPADFDEKVQIAQNEENRELWREIPF